MSYRTRYLALSAVMAINGIVLAVAAPDWGRAANIIMILLLCKSVIFVGLYAWKSNWRQTAPGRAVMGLMSCIAAILALGTINLYVGEYPGRPFVRAAAFVAIGFMITNLLLTLIAAQRDGGRR